MSALQWVLAIPIGIALAALIELHVHRKYRR